MKTVNIKKLIFCITSAIAITATVSMAGACSIETAHPEATITYSFNGKDYAVKYTLYRNMYSRTVKHFIELADEGFYNNTVIHNYGTNSDWFTGGYDYNEEYANYTESGNQMAEYFEKYSKEQAYMDLFNAGKLTPSVYSNIHTQNGKQSVDKADALPTLMGEFYNNIHQEIENGKLTQEYGCLKMYYYEKQSTQMLYVTPNNKQIIQANYKNNCATSIFAVQAGTSSSYSENNYTVFARVKDEESFDKLVDAVSDYIDTEHSGTSSNFYNQTNVRVDDLDNYSNKPETDKGITAEFNAPKVPIIVKTVKITKY